MSNILLDVKGLKTYFSSKKGEIPSVDNVSFSVNKGETVALVGESGSGKSVTSLSIMGLVESPGKVKNGEIIFEDKDLLKTSEKAFLNIRGNEMSMIFQEPLTSLNPVFTIGHQINESILAHQNLSKKEAKEKTIHALEKVGIPNPRQAFNMYPHFLSGGMRQRVMIAMALSCNPKLLIADEPTTALDVTIQAQILRLMKDLIRENNTAILMITHDIGVVATIADRVLVMYAGKIVEEGDVYSVFNSPKHPYTKGLLNSTPNINKITDKLESIKGAVPPPDKLPKGCSFHPRCEFATSECKTSEPPMFHFDRTNSVKCWLYKEMEEVTLHE
ncbi:ABC transporter ATP-binding protein [Virgibacillus sp. NKC19-3]|uniref:ABC transporter ATP-binding protein n=1 Tax=Virgibacillus saliphilus TaxID=2831674 RepID=UPI001C9AA0A4|nr:ABC transporter ATP-binding protein [Virgibacillus sp. NKC19-3]MBY7144581.1 ABC transporter ATP-binding protein [Virgibacillus sp. NKC19-3]